MQTITASDITASIGRKVIRARLINGSWVEVKVTSGFMKPLTGEVVRDLTDIEAKEAEAAVA
jgi:hypothetical protein